MSTDRTDRDEAVLKKDVQRCWDADPMSYGIAETPGTRRYFDAIDRLFEQLHFFGQRQRPLLSDLIDYPALRGQAVLEVGCGLGSMAEELSHATPCMYAIDLTSNAARATKQRFTLDGHSGVVMQADAEHLPFGDNSFDYVFSWGVLHHTPGTQQAVDEIHRVLRSGGRIGVMLYHRDSIDFYYHMMFKWGVIGGKLLNYNLQGILNLRTDKGDQGGTPLAKAYTKGEIQRMFARFQPLEQQIYGQKKEVDTIPMRSFPLFKWLVPARLRYGLLRRWGWYIWISGAKQG